MPQLTTVRWRLAHQRNVRIHAKSIPPSGSLLTYSVDWPPSITALRRGHSISSPAVRSTDHGLEPIQPRPAGGSTIYRASVRHSPPLWSLLLPTREPSDRDVTSRPGSASCQSNTRAGVKTGSAVSANEVIAICAACSLPAHSPSPATPRSMAPSVGPGLQRCWRGAKVAANALANKIARMAWAMMAKGERYKEPVALAT